jgi:lipopolysaccharide transport system ATP-binding protein
MSDLAIRVENLSKRYLIGERVPYKALRDVIAGAVQVPFHRLSHLVHRPSPNDRDIREKGDQFIWALKNVSFEVKQGEVIGIIGRNGAGKSTLLKILSRIAKPTEGQAKIHGRVGSLLEVGTGFHPELTGRENVYLNGAIIGMKRAEIRRKFDEIVAFAEIEQFLDTPVKRYSSGMYVRLAFAVAAHLEPEILLVDEVLAVGDVGFQKKCLGKMSGAVHEGRTVLLVSHNMTAIQSLCDRSILLDNGRIRAVGTSDDVVQLYLSDVGHPGVRTRTGVFDLTRRINQYLLDELIIRRLRLFDSQENPQDVFLMGQQMQLVIDLSGFSSYRDAIIGVIIKSNTDQWIASINTAMTCSHVDQPRKTNEQAVLRIPRVPFTPGSYWIDVSITQQGMGRLDYAEHAGNFTVTEADVYGSGYQVSAYFGVVYLSADWHIKGNDDPPNQT